MILHLAVMIQSDGQTDGHTMSTAYSALAWRRAVKGTLCIILSLIDTVLIRWLPRCVFFSSECYDSVGIREQNIINMRRQHVCNCSRVAWFGRTLTIGQEYRRISVRKLITIPILLLWQLINVIVSFLDSRQQMRLSSSELFVGLSATEW